MAGGTVSLAALAVGAAPLRYQWQFNGADISGATNSTLPLADVRLTRSSLTTRTRRIRRVFTGRLSTHESDLRHSRSTCLASQLRSVQEHLCRSAAFRP